MKVCYKAGAVTAKENYYSIAADAVEIRLWFLTDEILRIRAGFDGDWDEASYSLVTRHTMHSVFRICLMTSRISIR